MISVPATCESVRCNRRIPKVAVAVRAKTVKQVNFRFADLVSRSKAECKNEYDEKEEFHGFSPNASLASASSPAESRIAFRPLESTYPEYSYCNPRMLLCIRLGKVYG